MKKSLYGLIQCAQLFVLDETDAKNAAEYIGYNEFEVCYDLVVLQMYENSIEISQDFYDIIVQLGKKLKLPYGSYSFMQELIKDKTNLPKAIKDQLAEIINSLSKNIKR